MIGICLGRRSNSGDVKLFRVLYLISHKNARILENSELFVSGRLEKFAVF